MHSNLLEIASFLPRSLQYPNPWVGHLPFAAWVVQQVKPKLLVELGTHTGNSYFTFCQAIVQAGFNCNCNAVDTWKGDEHISDYGEAEEVFHQVFGHNQQHYNAFSHLLRMTFDQAAASFSDNTIDLLHIDGTHTYDAVKHDFETWLPKLTRGAVVLFHDINVREHGFGVWKLWDEIKELYTLHLEFYHSHGLGVIQLADGALDKQFSWLKADSVEQEVLKNYFSSLGTRQNERFELNELKTLLSENNIELSRRDEKIGRLNQIVTDNNNAIASFGQQVVDRDNAITSLKQTIVELKSVIAKQTSAISQQFHTINHLNNTVQLLYASTSWRITAPVRSCSHGLRQIRPLLRGALVP